MIIWGFVQILIGAFFIYIGAFTFITALLPHDYAMDVAKKHGAWMRENVFNLPPIEKETQ